MDGEMYGFIRNEDGALAVANRIFETRLYNYFLSVSEIKDNTVSKAASHKRDWFIVNETDINPPAVLGRLTERGAISGVKRKPPLYNLCRSSKPHRYNGGVQWTIKV